MNKKIKNNLFKLIIVVFLIIYLLYSSDTINELKASVKEVSKNVNIEEINQKNFSDTLDVYFIDVGQADSILIKQDDKYMLIDAGNNEDGKLLTLYFKELGITSFEHVVATHAHEDHIGGMDDIINNFEVKNFYMPDVITTTKTFEDMLDALSNKNLMYTVLKQDEEFKLSSASIKTIYIGGNEESDINDTSIVLRLEYEDVSFLFTGDASTKVENKILNKDIKSDVLKLGHHGSSYSSSTSFIDKVNPSYAVIQVGKNNSYNHPHLEILNKLNKNNIKIYRTDESGTIIFTTDGKNLNVKNIKTNTNG